MSLKKKQPFLLLGEQKKAIQDFIENIAGDEKTPFDIDVTFEGSDLDDKIPASNSESESEGEKGNEEYEQISRKKLLMNAPIRLTIVI